MRTEKLPTVRKKIDTAYSAARTSDMPHNLKTHVMQGLLQQLAAIDSFGVTGELPKRSRWRTGLAKILATCFSKAALAFVASLPCLVADTSKVPPPAVPQVAQVNVIANSFDTRQFTHILWETPEDLKEQLVPIIKARIV